MEYEPGDQSWMPGGCSTNTILLVTSLALSIANSILIFYFCTRNGPLGLIPFFGQARAYLIVEEGHLDLSVVTTHVPPTSTTSYIRENVSENTILLYVFVILTLGLILYLLVRDGRKLIPFYKRRYLSTPSPEILIALAQPDPNSILNDPVVKEKSHTTAPLQVPASRPSSIPSDPLSITDS